MTALAALKQKIDDLTARICVVGLGYVGLPLAVEMAKAGYRVEGIDVTQSKVDKVNRGESYVGDVDDEVLGDLVRRGVLTAGTSYDPVSDADCIRA